MVYIEINGVRLEQDVLLAIVETIVAHAFVAILFLTIYLPCLRPPKRWYTKRWLRPWKIYMTLYSVLALITEMLWVQMGTFSWVRSNASDFVCTWSTGHLAVWTLVQASFLVAILMTWTYSQRVPLAHRLSSICGTHAMVMMMIMMAGMYEFGACGAMAFPLLTSSVGMAVACCCMPWHIGAWDMRLPGGEAAVVGSDDERSKYTTAGWWCLSRKRRRESQVEGGRRYHMFSQRPPNPKIMLMNGNNGNDDEDEASAFLSEVEGDAANCHLMHEIVPHTNTSTQIPMTTSPPSSSSSSSSSSHTDHDSSESEHSDNDSGYGNHSGGATTTTTITSRDTKGDTDKIEQSPEARARDFSSFVANPKDWVSSNGEGTKEEQRKSTSPNNDITTTTTTTTTNTNMGTIDTLI
jgi:hypothetical protein